MKRATDNYKQMHRAQHKICWYCSRSAEKLSACSKCLPIGRKVAYCSRCVHSFLRLPRMRLTLARACQIEDWKNGIPQAHKLICGKAMTEDELAMLAPPTPRNDAEGENWLPQPDRSLKPSPELLHQLAELRESKVHDYFVRTFVLRQSWMVCAHSPAQIIDPTVNYRVGIRFGFDQMEKLMFIVYRNRGVREPSTLRV